MAMKLEIIRIGRSAGVVLPDELLAHLKVGPGDTLYASETPGGILLTASDPDAAMATARTVMTRRRRALRDLAN